MLPAPVCLDVCREAGYIDEQLGIQGQEATAFSRGPLLSPLDAVTRITHNSRVKPMTTAFPAVPPLEDPSWPNPS